jgi:hypothetical protein
MIPRGIVYHFDLLVTESAGLIRAEVLFLQPS